MLLPKFRLSLLVLCCLVCSVIAWRANGEQDTAAGDTNESSRRVADAANYNTRGVAWKARGEYDKAIADYNEAIRLDPTKAGYHNNRGIAWEAKGEYDKAIADYNEAIWLDPAYADAFANRGLPWIAKGEYDRAIANYNEAIRLDPTKVGYHNNRGIAWQAKGEYDKAIADYNEAIRLDPKYADAYNKLAWLLATCPDAKYRNGRKAITQATRACYLTNWKVAGWIDTLAAAYAETGDFDKAVEWQTKAVGMVSESEKPDYQSRLDLYRAGKPYRQ